jgi:hypothetical protein
MIPLVPARQIHLDFHTSEHIPDVGARFDKKQFKEALRVGHVNAINLFAKCHHGWSYYPTKVGMPHPNLKCDLLGQEINACHEIGIRAPIYYTIGFSVADLERHPEWVARDKDGTILPRDYGVNARPTDRKPIFEWKFVCPNDGYREQILAQTEEICAMFDVDGFWYDICGCSGPCYCERCRKGMRDAGMDPASDADGMRYFISTWERVLTETTRVIRGRHPTATVYFNGMTQFWDRDFTRFMSQIELEDLPSVGGSYDKFPLAAKHYSTRGKGLIAMSGKFHTAWGEFGGFKHPDALRYETASMIAFGSGSSMGDQMHPSGLMDMTTYRNIGAAYEYVEKVEEYGLNAEYCANLGLWTSGALAHDQGVANMLLENQVDFEALESGSRDLSRFSTIVLTGAPCLNEADAAVLRTYVEGGGSILCIGSSALDRSGTRFLLDVGAEYLGPAAFDMDYTVAGRSLVPDFIGTAFLNDTAALRTRATDGEILATIKEPYFNRTYERYSSHQNTPNRLEDAAHPAAVRKGRIVSLFHPLGRIYNDLGARVHRDYLMKALGLLYRDPIQEVRLPSAGRVNLMHQPFKKRYMTHLLYANPMKRGRCLVIEDMPPLFDIEVTLRVPQKVRKAYLAPQGEGLKLNRSGTAVSVRVPKLQCHQIVVWEY